MTTVQIFGNGGTFNVDVETGRAFDHAHSGEDDHDGYADVVSVDLAEWRTFWGKELPGALDILDVRCHLASGETIEPEPDHREAIASGWRTLG